MQIISKEMEKEDGNGKHCRSGSGWWILLCCHWWGCAPTTRNKTWFFYLKLSSGIPKSTTTLFIHVNKWCRRRRQDIMRELHNRIEWGELRPPCRKEQDRPFLLKQSLCCCCYLYLIPRCRLLCPRPTVKLQLIIAIILSPPPLFHFQSGSDWIAPNIPPAVAVNKKNHFIHSRMFEEMAN